jgi:hypothetical protein
MGLHLFQILGPYILGSESSISDACGVFSSVSASVLHLLWLLQKPLLWPCLPIDRCKGAEGTLWVLNLLPVKSKMLAEK